jgi:hypothetical protein
MTFKKGDVVRCVESFGYTVPQLTVGREYVVLDVNAQYTYVTPDHQKQPGGYVHSRFVLVRSVARKAVRVEPHTVVVATNGYKVVYDDGTEEFVPEEISK